MKYPLLPSPNMHSPSSYHPDSRNRVIADDHPHAHRPVVGEQQASDWVILNHLGRGRNLREIM